MTDLTQENFDFLENELKNAKERIKTLTERQQITHFFIDGQIFAIDSIVNIQSAKKDEKYDIKDRVIISGRSGNTAIIDCNDMNEATSVVTKIKHAFLSLGKIKIVS